MTDEMKIDGLKHPSLSLIPSKKKRKIYRYGNVGVGKIEEQII